MGKIVNLLRKNILSIFGLVIGITISNMVIGATNGGLSAGSVDINTTNMPNISGTTLADALDYLYEKAELVGSCPDGYACLKRGLTVEWTINRTYMGIAYLNPADLTDTCNATLASQNLNSKTYPTPTEVKEGCMKWYIYGTDENDDYLAILDHNTTAIVQWNASNSNVAFENSVAYSYLTDLTTPVAQGGYGWVLPTRIISGQEIANLTGNTSWNASTYSFYFFGSNSTTNYSNMNVNQKAKQESFAWLFDYTYGCTSYGCNNDDPNISYASSSKESWGYWTMTPKDSPGDGSNVWYVESGGMLYNTNANRTIVGLRPVITLPKEMFE